MVMFSIFYFLYLFNSPAIFNIESWDLRSNQTLHCLRLILTALFILYLLYLKSDLGCFVFYSYDFLIVLFFSFLSLNFILLSSSTLNLFIFIEIFSLTIYYLIAASKQNNRSLEASVKYYIFGSVGSIFLLFGFYLLYLTTGTFKFDDIFLFTYNNPTLNLNIFFHLSIILIALSLLSKIGASFFFFLSCWCLRRHKLSYVNFFKYFWKSRVYFCFIYYFKFI